ncbi:MAG: DUF59 domain-containing protein [Prevotellaceae bacterium]|nr:DUF59 domain-containing protein [Prevotellaceae bacterium]
MATNPTKYDIETRAVELLKTVFDPEIPVNVFDLGLIYKIDVVETPDTDGTQPQFDIHVDMTLTAPNCPAADFIMEDIQQKLDTINGVHAAHINLVFEPEWTKDMMSEEARLDLGMM